MPAEIPQIAFSGGSISPAVFSRVDLAKFTTAVKTLRNFFVRAEGGASNRAGFQFVKEVKSSSEKTRLIPFEFNEEQAYILEFGDLYVRMYSDGGAVLETAKNITAATSANPVVITSSSHGLTNGQEVYITGVVGMTEINGKYFKVADKTTNTFELQNIDGANINGSGYTSYTSDGTAAVVHTVVTPYTTAQLAKLKFRQSNDTLYLTHTSHAPRKLVRTGAANWTLTTITFAAEQAVPTSVTTTPQGSSGSTTYEYRVTAVSDETAEESDVVNTSTTSGNATLSDTNFNRIAFSASSGAGSYNIYKEDNGLYGFIGSTETTTFDDKNIAADLDDTAPKARNPFDSTSNYPGAIGLHEQRSVWGNSTTDPLTVWMSQTSQFENMNVSSPTRDSDAVTIRLVTGRGNEVRHFRSFQDRLFIFTSGAVWSLKPGGDVDAITPASKKLSIEEYVGSTDVPPLTIKSNLLICSGQANLGFEVHSLGYKFETDAYAGSDLTILARHLFEGQTIDEWTYAERPFHFVACVRDDGKLIVMTYLQEHQVFAWSIWEASGTDAAFESIASVPESQSDVLYVIVKRTINGTTRRYIEFLHTRTFSSIEDAFFVDGGLTLDSPITMGGISGSCTVTVTDYTNIATGTTLKFTKSDGTTVKFTSEASSGSAPAETLGFRPNESNDTTADNIYTAVNAHADFTVANPAANVVTITETAKSGVAPLTVISSDTTRLAITNEAAVIAATKAKPCVITATGHGLSDGDNVKIRNITGMTELNNDRFIVIEKTTNTLELLDTDGVSNVTAITKANPGVVTTMTAHGYSTGDEIGFLNVGGMTQLNGNGYTATVINTTSFSIGVDSSSYGTYTSGGKVYKNTDSSDFTTYISGGELYKEVTSITGLDHLEGESIIALADGNLVTGLTVSSGAITLPNDSSIVHVGLSYDGTIESLPLDLSTKVGATVSKNKIVKQVSVRVQDSRGLFIGPDDDTLQEYPSRSTELWGDPAATLTDLIKFPISDDWAREAGVAIKSEQGLPMTVLSMMADTDVGS